MHVSSQSIFTASPNAGQPALDEIRAASPAARLRVWLAPGVGLVRLAGDWQTLAHALRATPPIFFRHICPVQATVALQMKLEDIEQLAHAVRPLLAHLSKAETFSVQTRLLGGAAYPYGRFDVNQRLAAVLQEAGAQQNVRCPAQALSVVCTPEHGYLGLSQVCDNLSDWAGGERRFKRGKSQISRAAFKLEEALEVFGIDLPGGGLALDMGAAPGGWTKILLDRGLRVMAVDPASLHPSLEAHPRVTHVRKTMQRFLPARKQFDVILNDMRMDARASARLMLSAARHLKGRGVAVVTLKLPEKKMARAAQAALTLLQKGYRVRGARQLFHNRNEITVVLERK